MKEKEMVERCVNPFIWIAGSPALLWGAVGLVVSTLLGWLSGYHYHGLLHFGPAPNPAWWCYLAERIIVWLVPAVLFYVGGLAFSRSRIRVIDVFGTVLFAQIPLTVMSFIYILPPMKVLLHLDPTMSPQEMLEQPGLILAMILSLFILPFLIAALVWMFNALKVSCNLKGWRLWTVGLVGIIGGDVVCRLIIRLLY